MECTASWVLPAFKTLLSRDEKIEKSSTVFAHNKTSVSTHTAAATAGVGGGGGGEGGGGDAVFWLW